MFFYVVFFSLHTYYVDCSLFRCYTPNYCTFEWYSNVLHQISHNALSAQACRYNEAVIVWLCVCTADSPLAKAHGLSSVHTHKPYNNLHLQNPRSLISAFYFYYMQRMLSKLVSYNISWFYLAHVAECESAWFSLTWSQTPKTGFLVIRSV